MLFVLWRLYHSFCLYVPLRSIKFFQVPFETYSNFHVFSIRSFKFRSTASQMHYTIFKFHNKLKRPCKTQTKGLRDTAIYIYIYYIYIYIYMIYCIRYTSSWYVLGPAWYVKRTVSLTGYANLNTTSMIHFPTEMYHKVRTRSLRDTIGTSLFLRYCN